MNKFVWYAEQPSFVVLIGRPHTSHGHALTHLPSTIRIDASNNAQMMNGKSATLIEGGEMTLSVSLEGLRGMVRGVLKNSFVSQSEVFDKRKAWHVCAQAPNRLWTGNETLQHFRC